MARGTRIFDQEEMLRNVSDFPSMREDSKAKTSRFLYASLQLAALQQCATIHDVEKTLQEIPRGMEAFYVETWMRILDQDQMDILLVKTALLWILTASRAVTLEELESAVATDPNTHKFDPNRLIPGVKLIGLCRGLVTVDEESGLVRLVRESDFAQADMK